MKTTHNATSPVATSPGVLYRVGRAVLWPLARVLYRPTVTGRENVPRSGPVLFASNHLSALDSLAIPLAAPRHVQFLTKAHYFEGPGILGAVRRWFFTSIGAVPVHRGAGHAAQEALDSGREVLRNGHTFAVYPEGTRSRDGRLYKGRTGVGWLALETRATVIPVGLIGTDGQPPAGQRRGRTPVRVAFGRPVDLSDLSSAGSGADRREATDRIMAAVHGLSGQEWAGSYNDVPEAG
ncbi:lysophospholipid acyltransferase family protein [Klugiella xanthotipulae]|uniref:1-acyl-sn-glycerol-3-phosphate acyltransferase n=1 Tax=Klugiella xanthotipulae TaxID=244735 RepID=A0A543I4L3_9MICO|nr:lysophospholipid acyltransferase family protein [Klugiella xanthotipulae]TQM65538.1 1-acyl-sn-glycerol-3-phosphate acyltransferase [Klugiella xanthotipulae]